ncbi:MAG: SSU ribosomal protein S2P [Parcubacteria group bacterium LiPW_39]|nr:MAG: SSU ribosomal protein S2P [Parcubacteria group bacterium LiPW_39]
MTDEQKTQIQGELKLPSAQELFEAGVHFGHRTSRWHPKMEQYIYGTRNNVHIFDLEKTLAKMAEALVFLQGVLARGGSILLAGTKPAAKNFIKEAAQELGMPYVSQRWLGGTLTNFKTITKRLQYLKNLEEEEKSGAWEEYVKKEKLQLRKKMAKLNQQMEGIKGLVRLPETLFVVDVKVDNIAIREAKRVGIPVVAICDTNSDPSLIDYPIPANDDATPALKIIIDTIVQNLKEVKPIEIKAEKQKEGG